MSFTGIYDILSKRISMNISTEELLKILQAVKLICEDIKIPKKYYI